VKGSGSGEAQQVSYAAVEAVDLLDDGIEVLA
jgi:hypothetical protein